jgi:glycogen synthase
MSQYKKIYFANKKKKQLLFVGKRDGYKNFNWLINSVFDWLKINDYFLLCVGGNSFSKEELSELAFLSIDDRVMQKNLSDQDLVYAYSESFALIVPSLYEGFCFPIVEAMSLNCPVVYANNSCLPEIAAQAGVSFSQNDKNELYNCLNQLLNNTEYSHDYNKSMLDYQIKASKLRLGYTPGIIKHHYHGSKQNRRYTERWQILMKYKYSPINDLTYDDKGILIPTNSFSNHFKEDIMNYFRERKEDE